ncbi:Mu transposase C-terminal domain-containing protein [Halomonas pacifica]|uniref:Mu transposase C-terminal domain-containing protein n=1 Tax=Bisbaumannia pacifica TaxID=77098 RepID=UPI002358CDD4|nr:Mu transposase C-terminal domain-containing protein [Halomonas pacifica]MDC8804254.1 Mu transposase C-terminal domain-containing protein [Halomonas pacifica]
MTCREPLEATTTIREIAAALGISRQGAVKRAAAGGWTYTEVKGRGGRQRRYPINQLPAEIREALATQRAAAAVSERMREWEQGPEGRALQEAAAYAREQREAEEAKRAARRARKESGMAQFAALPADHPKRQRAKARESALLALWDFQRQRHLTLGAALELFSAGANAGDIYLPEGVWEWMPHYQGRRALTAATLKRWHLAYRNEGIHALVDGYGARKGRFKVLDIPGLDRVVIGLMLEQPHITPKKVKAYVAAKHPEMDQLSVTSYRRFMDHWREQNAQAYTYATNPDQWKNHYMAAVGSHHERIERLNQVWELDSTPGDWLLADGRHSVIGVIDLYSRRLKLLVSKTSTALAVCQVFRRATLDWGICEIARTDNGKDYVSRQFTSALRDLEVEQELCVPFASEQKGTVERAFRTMSHGILDLLPGFIGHNVAERKVIEARKSFAQRVMTPGETVQVEMTSEELQQLLDQWCEIYHHTAHSGLAERSPFEVANAWAQPVRRIQDERALDLLLAEIAGTRTIRKKGIALDNHYYDAPELFEYVGQEAVIKRDEADIGRVYVYVEGEFVAVAECAELLGISRKERAAAARAAQRRFMAAQQQEYRQFKKGVDKNIGRVVLDHQLEQIHNIETLHRPSIDHTPEGLRQAGRAAGRELPPIAETTPQQDDARAQLAAEMAAAAPVAEVDTPKRRYERWLRLDRRAQGGERLPEGEATFYRSYPGTEEYRSMKGFYDDFDLGAEHP